MIKSIIPSRKTIKHLPVFILFGGSTLFQNVNAQLAVTAVFTTSQNATTATAYSGTGASGLSTTALATNNYNYKFGSNLSATNNNLILDSFTVTGGIRYRHMPVAQVIKFRRVNNASVTGRRKSILIEQSGGTVNPNGTASLLPDYDDSLERIFNQRHLNLGIDNLFQNNSVNNNNNIERMDVIVQTGIRSSDNTKAGFAIFERGNAGGHDAFYIAAIKTLDASGNPSSYFPAALVSSGSYGSGVIGTMPYLLMRQNPGEPRMLLFSNNSPQNRDGVFINFAVLGVSNNTYVYGYSIFSTDTDVSPDINMVDYTNATNFPIDSDLGSGGLDPLAVTGLWVTDATYIVLAARTDQFQATAINNEVKLSWQLTTTDDLEKIIVERSADGNTYSPVLSVTAPVPGPQSIFDRQPAEGKNYYRLKLINIDGTILSYSDVSWIDMAARTSIYLSVYPNPVKNKRFNLYASGLKNQLYEVRIYNMEGKLVSRQSLNGEAVINKELYLPVYIKPGLFALQLVDDKGNRIIERTVTVE